MAQLYFKFGAMGSSKTANALMARFNYEERGQETLLVKPRLDTRDGDHMVYSRIGLKHPCIYFDETIQTAGKKLCESPSRTLYSKREGRKNQHYRRNNNEKDPDFFADCTGSCHADGVCSLRTRSH